MEEVPLLIFLLLLSGFFSGTEIALFSLGAEKLQAFKNAEENQKIRGKIEALEKLKADSEKLLVTILIGNNIANVAASSMATVVALRMGENLGMTDNANLVIGIVTGIMTFLILIFGEITPKALAHKYALRFSLFSAPILRVLQIILYPVVYPISGLTKKFTGNEAQKHGLSEDELKAAIELSQKEGQIDAEERDLVEKVLEFDEHTVESIMTPRSKVFSLPDNTPVMDAIEKISAEKFSRIPIHHDTLDELIGVLKVNQILDEMQKPDFEEKNVANLSLLAPIKIPLTMKIDTLLKQFQADKNHMAFVYDEHGGLIGLITLEDIIEEIFGEFEDESDEEVNHIRQNGKKTFTLNPEIELEHIEKFLAEKFGDESPKKFPWKGEDENKVLSYFLLEKLEHFPDLGEQVTVEVEETIFVFTVKEKDEEKMTLVELELR